jgi:hypothetical protein
MSCAATSQRCTRPTWTVGTNQGRYQLAVRKYHVILSASYSILGPAGRILKENSAVKRWKWRGGLRRLEGQYRSAKGAKRMFSSVIISTLPWQAKRMSYWEVSQTEPSTHDWNAIADGRY